MIYCGVPQVMITTDEQYTTRPYYNEDYDELEAFSYEGVQERDRELFIEERRKYEEDEVLSFSIIVLNNFVGRGYIPYFEIQHEPRADFSGINLCERGLELWELDGKYKRLGRFTGDYPYDFSNYSDNVCYELVREEHFDSIIKDTLEELSKYREAINND